MPVTAQEVKSVVLKSFASQLQQRGIAPESISDSFDLFAEGVIDSLGVMEMIGAVETAFGVAVDFENLAAEQLTVIGPFSAYVAQQLNQTTAPAK